MHTLMINISFLKRAMSSVQITHGAIECSNSGTKPSWLGCAPAHPILENIAHPSLCGWVRAPFFFQKNENNNNN